MEYEDAPPEVLTLCDRIGGGSGSRMMCMYAHVLSLIVQLGRRLYTVKQGQANAFHAHAPLRLVTGGALGSGHTFISVDGEGKRMKLNPQIRRL